MSAQRLGEKKVRRIARAAGVEVLRGWSHGGYWLSFVTADHRHGYYHTTTREVEWQTQDRGCYTSCRELPPQRFGPPDGA